MCLKGFHTTSEGLYGLIRVLRNAFKEEGGQPLCSAMSSQSGFPPKKFSNMIFLNFWNWKSVHQNMLGLDSIALNFSTELKKSYDGVGDVGGRWEAP